MYNGPNGVDASLGRRQHIHAQTVTANVARIGKMERLSTGVTADKLVPNESTNLAAFGPALPTSGIVAVACHSLSSASSVVIKRSSTGGRVLVTT